MPQMTDPLNALNSFQSALRRGEIYPQQCETDSSLHVLLDRPNGEIRLTYVRLNHGKVTALATFVSGDPMDGLPCFNVGYAVPEKYRRRGRAKDIVNAAINEMKHGFSRTRAASFYVEAIVGVDNIASQHVASVTISTDPIPVTDEVSGLPALHYVRKIDDAPTAI
jgi:hypothetical protein